MPHCIYEKASPADMPDVLDHANYVFSASSVPHDFAALLPKVYAKHAPFEAADQYIARKDGKIRALVALRPVTLTAADVALQCGYVGTVSVHPYSRGEGHMKQLMALMHRSALEKGMDVLVLGGQRQRYRYFGFEKGGVCTTFTVTATNLRHTLRDADDSAITFADIDKADAALVDRAYAMHQAQQVHVLRGREEFIDVLHSWKCRCDIILQDGAMIGYVAGDSNEILLEREELLPLVLRAVMRERGVNKLRLQVYPWQQERMAVLSAICEDCTLGCHDMLCVLNWPRVIEGAMKLRALYRPLADGVCTIAIDGQTLRLSVQDGVPAVAPCEDAPQLTLTGVEAQALLFGEGQLLLPDARLHGWAPLPLSIPTQDCF